MITRQIKYEIKSSEIESLKSRLTFFNFIPSFLPGILFPMIRQSWQQHPPTPKIIISVSVRRFSLIDDDRSIFLQSSNGKQESGGKSLKRKDIFLRKCQDNNLVYSFRTVQVCADETHEKKKMLQLRVEWWLARVVSFFLSIKTRGWNRGRPQNEHGHEFANEFSGQHWSVQAGYDAGETIGQLESSAQEFGVNLATSQRAAVKPYC